jgi:transcriptional regulator
MYVPQSFRISDEAELEGFMQRFDFATVISAPPAGLMVSHVPVVVRRGAEGLVLEGHVARANPHWKVMDGVLPSLVIFNGPHAYVSPTWYASAPAVPTWSYAVVHAHGRLRARPEKEFLETVVARLTARYEDRRARPWRLEDTPPEFRDGLLSAIVGFEMAVERIDGKYKLGQTRPAEDRAATVAGLEAEGTGEAAALATFMRSYFERG